MDQQPGALLAHRREYRLVHSERPEGDGLEGRSYFVEAEGFREPGGCGGGVVDDYIDATGGCQDVSYGFVDGCLVGDVEFNDLQMGVLRGGPPPHGFCGFGVLAIDASHRREDMVTAPGQRLSGAASKAAARAGDEDGKG